MPTKISIDSVSPIIEALQADGPFPEQAEKLMLFGRLVGSWDIEGRAWDEDGKVTREGTGEWHWGWALEGRVVLDVLIAPPREGRASGEASSSYDAAIRAYDPETDTWRVTVVAPIYGATVVMLRVSRAMKYGARARARRATTCGGGPFRKSRKSVLAGAATSPRTKGRRGSTTRRSSFIAALEAIRARDRHVGSVSFVSFSTARDGGI
jgi:hypothetical protein